jgi:CRISPR-associated endoribonuclease Cas6
MRLIIEFEPTSEFSYDYINKHSIQGLIYYLLKNTSFDNLHSTNKFKYFTFSDIFPVYIQGWPQCGFEKNYIVRDPTLQRNSASREERSG